MTTLAPRPETDDANEAAVKAARDAYRPAYEQGLDSDVASLAAYFGWHAAIKAARAEIEREILGSLRDRLDSAVAMAKAARNDAHHDDPAWMHRAGKVDGIKLALSYLDEALRTDPPAEEDSAREARYEDAHGDGS